MLGPAERAHILADLGSLLFGEPEHEKTFHQALPACRTKVAHHNQNEKRDKTFKLGDDIRPGSRQQEQRKFRAVPTLNKGIWSVPNEARRAQRMGRYQGGKLDVMYREPVAR